LTKHILFNLIKNALQAIKEIGQGEVYISLKHDKKFNYLIFKDTASEITAKVCETLFQQYSSDSGDGAGLGLAFCKMVMQS
jgi:signal transduction histidine kinase